MCILSGGFGEGSAMIGEVRAGTMAGRLCAVPAEPAGTRSRPRPGLLLAGVVEVVKGVVGVV